MVVWVRVALLCGAVLACGGRAQRVDRFDDPDASGGANAGSPGEAGRSGSSGGHAGASTGAGDSAGSGVAPTAGRGGEPAGIGGASGATSGASGSMSGEGGATAGTEGPPPGEPAGTRECPQGPATDYRGALPELESSFRGVLDGIPVEIDAAELGGGAGCSGTKTATVELFFEGAFAGDQLTLYFDAGAGCLLQAWYVANGQSAEPTTVRSALHVWHEGDPSETPEWSQLVYAELVIESIGLDGNITHRLEGTLTLRLASSICVG